MNNKLTFVALVLAVALNTFLAVDAAMHGTYWVTAAGAAAAVVATITLGGEVIDMLCKKPLD